jgi:hypothetical protein
LEILLRSVRNKNKKISKKEAALYIATFVKEWLVRLKKERN